MSGLGTFVKENTFLLIGAVGIVGAIVMTRLRVIERQKVDAESVKDLADAGVTGSQGLRHAPVWRTMLTPGTISTVLVAAFSVVGAFLHHRYVYAPMLPQIEVDSARSARLRDRNEAVRQSIAAFGLPRLRARIAGYAQMQAAFGALVPPRDSSQRVLGTVYTTATLTDTRLTSVHPDSLVTEGDYAVRRYRVVAGGTYDAVGQFLTQLANGRQIMRPTQVVIRPMQVPAGSRVAGAGDVTIGFVLETEWSIAVGDATGDVGASGPLSGAVDPLSAPTGVPGALPALPPAPTGAPTGTRGASGVRPPGYPRIDSAVAASRPREE
ncbi:MAG: hypothetical protein C0497_03800 [Gemmatimonas sp.]|nr:hypothetical protein [Gemmatimonas sp.]